MSRDNLGPSETTWDKPSWTILDNPGPPGSRMIQELRWLRQRQFRYKYGRGWTCFFLDFQDFGKSGVAALGAKGENRGGGWGALGFHGDSGAVECQGQSSSVPLPERSWKGEKRGEELGARMRNLGGFRIGFGGQAMDLGASQDLGLR